MLKVILLVWCCAASVGCKDPQAKMPLATEDARQDDSASQPAAPREVNPPSQTGAMAPNLYRRPGGAIGATWLEDGADGNLRMQHSVFSGGEWASPDTIVEADDFFANWADLPSAAVGGDGALYAHWLAKVEGGTYAYGVQLARSADDGKTWTRLGSPHDDSPTEHGFVSMLPSPGGVTLAWLDGRQTAAKGGAMALRAATVGETVGEQTVLDERVCDCCATSGAVASGRSVIVYRDRDAQEVRDISFVTKTGDSWSKPATVHADRWTVPGCPVNGPALNARGEHLVAVWFTGAGQKARVRAAFSADAGASFGAGIDLGAGGGAATMGRVDVAWLDDKSVVISYVDTTESGAVIRARRLGTNGRVGAPIDVTPTSASRASGFPRLAVVGNDFLIVWTVPNDSGSTLRGLLVPTKTLPKTEARTSEPARTGPAIGWQLPLFKAQTLDGEDAWVRAKDKPTFINLWATWCEPCRRELPMLEELHEKFPDVAMFAVSIDEQSKRAELVDEAKKLSLLVLHDPDNYAARVFGATSLPASFLFDAAGKLVWFELGEFKDAAALGAEFRRVSK